MDESEAPLQDTISHLERALEVEEADKTKYHVRQALQLLYIE
ncbi:hypothetical protein [Haloarcula nitratireducens]|nr:hypothetical protein [Halomicroarcula nitratireducens]